MRISHFFIDRPIFAAVISVVFVIVGAVSFFRLPVAQYPEIAPPIINVTGQYPGASADVVASTVVSPIEDQINGVENMIYMSSNATSDGRFTIAVSFDIGTNLDIAQVQVQNRVAIAQPRVPADVRNIGITVTKASPDIIMVVNVHSPDKSRDSLFLSNYSTLEIKDALTRVDGVGSITVFGGRDFAMRIWLDPDRLQSLNMTANDVVASLQGQNIQVASGVLNQQPMTNPGAFEIAVQTQGRLAEPDQFSEIVVKQTPGALVRLKDVARVELGAQNYSVVGRLNGKPGAIIAAYQLPGSNGVQAAAGLKKLMAEAKTRFPGDIDYVTSLDTTLAVTQGIKEIVITLGIAIILVIIVVYIFLQGWRATLIPLLAVPVSLVGTFIFFPLFGFSINTLSLFGLVLAIGLVVDDAIVVVEAVERHIEDGLAPKAAALKAMEEISGPVVGIALVLSAVFIPTAFIPGITGRLYQQFAVTIAISVALSAFNALTLSPALAALLLRPKAASGGLLKKLFAKFNRGFTSATNAYVRVCGLLIRKSAFALLLLAIFGAAAGFFSTKVPSSFLPDEDQGYLYINLQLPNAASLQRTDEVARKIEAALAKTPGVQYTTSVVGFSLLSFVRTSYNGFFFVTLKPWDDRKSRDEQFQQIKMNINRELGQIPEGIAFSFSPPAIPGVGTSGGFTFVLEDRAGSDVQFLADNLNTFLTAARKRPEIAGVNTTFLPSVPQQFVDVDRDKVIKQGVAVNDVYKTLQAFMGGLFINYFNRFGRQWQVYIEAEGEYRTRAENVGQFFVKNDKGGMVPLAAVTRFESRPGPEFTMRFNEYRSAQINGAAAPGYSAGQAMAAMEEVFAQTMPREMGYDYLGMSFQEKKAQEGVPASAVFGFSLLFVFLILAALYESWSLPFSVLLSTPVAVFGAFFVLWLRRILLSAFLPSYMVQIENDVYSQIGLVMLIGLAAKNAILIVEFAKDEFEKGKPLVDAALEGARLRLRPILMTSFAFILGCVPLWTASGAGSVARQIMGTAVIGGMLAASAIGIFFIPAVFYVVERLSMGKAGRAAIPGAVPAGGDD